MRSLFFLFLSLFCLISFSSCKTRTYHAAAGRFQVAQVADISCHKEGLIATVRPHDPGKLAVTKKEIRAESVTKTKKNIERKTQRLIDIKKKVDVLAYNPFTAIKSVKHTQDARLVDILFFVVLAILLSTILVILKQKGLATDAVIFIAMGAAIVIAVAYIYLHTWIFTA